FLDTTPRPRRSPTFPYTTLFRSEEHRRAVLEVAALGDAIRAIEQLGVVAQHLAHLHGRENVELALFAIAVGVLAGEKRAFRMRRSEEHTSELQSLTNLVCRLLLE